MVAQFKNFQPQIKVEKAFADSGYDANENFKIVIKDLAAKPYIAINQRGKENPFISENVYLDKEGHLRCLGGKELVYWGKERKRGACEVSLSDCG